MSRKTGQTTRQANEAIETLFKEGEVIIKDHGNSKWADNNLMYIIVGRLDREHGGLSLYSFDRANNKITIKQKRRNGF